eukprot:m.224352 g.224352  ORF g.224352 m.224352 type:complete len:252 (-) comp15650_c1_seq3:1536-2291(-)
MCWSTLGVLKKHGKELQAFFKDCGVMNSRGQWIQSELRRVGNTDECPSHARVRCECGPGHASVYNWWASASRVATFFEAAYHREVQRPVTLRELRVLELPRDQPTAEGKTKRTSVYGCIKGKRLLESLQEAEQEADAAAETKRLKLDLEAPVRELLVELGYVGADDTMKRAMLSLFAKKNKETFSFVWVGTQLLHYAKRDEIVQKVRRWMVEGEFDPSEEGAGEGSPRSVAELIVQLVPNALPEHDEAGEP